MRQGGNPDGAAHGKLELQTVLGFEIDESLVVLVVLLGLCTVGTDAEYAVAQAKVLAFAVELVQVGKTAVVDFDHPVEQTPAEAVDEGLALPVEVGS